MVRDYNCQLDDVNKDRDSLILDFKDYIPDLVNNVGERLQRKYFMILFVFTHFSLRHSRT